MGTGITHTGAYDANGNILSMKQYGVKINNSSVIDELQYHYLTGSNKLQNVVDAQNDPQTRLGDFRSSSAYLTLLGTKTSAAVDYTYDDNGNLLKDLNKDIGTSSGHGIVYNYLNLPYQISVAGKGIIQYIYDATGNKLSKKTVQTDTVTKTTQTDYISGAVYLNDTLQYLGHEEGRIRRKTGGGWVYDYFVKDHLGNTRMVLSEEQQQDTYPVATLEDGATATEGTYYTINTGAIAANPASLTTTYPNNNGNPPYNTNPTSNTTATSLKMYKLNGASGDKTGLGITLRVMSGDQVAVLAKSFWHSPGTNPANSYNIVVNDLLTALAGTSAIVSANKGISAATLTGSAVTPGEVASLLGNEPVTITRPKAYLNWILFDEQFRPVSGSSGFDAVNDNSDQLKSHLTNVSITKNGYLYVYCSNESDIDVFFDNLQVIHNRGPLLEETHYYPFGLTMAGISSKAAGKLENRVKFNSMELQSGEFADGSGLNMYEYKYRFYDHQIGRFISQDGLADKYPYYAPYQFAGNEPTRAIDLDGLEPAYFNQTGTDRFGLPTGYQTQSGDNLRRPISNQQSFTKSVGKPSTGDFKQAMIGMAGIAGIAALPFVAEAAPALWVSAAPEITALQGIEVGALGGAAAGGAMAASEGAGIRQNAAQGAAFEQEGVAGLKAAGNTGVVEQVTVKAANGVKVRLDALSIDVTGNICKYQTN